jgi:hypothetical protein
MRVRIVITGIITGTIVACLGAGTAEAVDPYHCGQAGGRLLTLRDPDVPGQAVCHCQNGFYDGQAVYGSYQTPEGWITCIM